MPITFTREEATYPSEGIVVQYRAKAPDGHLGEISASAKLIAIQGTIVIDGVTDMQTVVDTLLKCVAHQKHLSQNQFALDGRRSLTEEEVSLAIANLRKGAKPA